LGVKQGENAAHFRKLPQPKSPSEQGEESFLVDWDFYSPREGNSMKSLIEEDSFIQHQCQHFSVKLKFLF
jgi:hypothetical protein